MPKFLVYLSIIASLAVSYFIIPVSQKQFFNQILVWLIPVLEISIAIIVVFSVYKSITRYKKINKNKENDFLELTRISLEPKLGNGFVLEAIMTELSVFYYSIIVWFRSPVLNKEISKYSYYRTSQIKTIVIFVAILISLEGTLFHFLIQLWSNVAAWIFTALNIYALLYIIGLYNSVKALPHLITFDKLIIRLGFQSSIEVDISNIESIKNANKQGGIGEKIPKDTYYSLMNMDSPQYEISLKEPALMKSSYGRRKYVKTVIFRADEPMKMVEDIKSKIKL